MDLTQIWGNKEEIGLLECGARAAVMFVIMVVMLRIAGMRTFGKGDVFDNILTILFGAVLARGIVGATPFLSAVTGGVVILAIHKLLARLSFYNRQVGRKVKGKSMLLYTNGMFIARNMKKADISKNDIEEELRLKLNSNSLEKVEEIYFERTGKISFVTKSPLSL